MLYKAWCICGVCVCVYWDAFAMMNMCRSEGNFVKLILSCHIFVGLGAWAKLTWVAEPSFTCWAILVVLEDFHPPISSFYQANELWFLNWRRPTLFSLSRLTHMIEMVCDVSGVWGQYGLLTLKISSNWENTGDVDVGIREQDIANEDHINSRDINPPRGH